MVLTHTLAAFLIFATGYGAEILLIYPRLESGQDTFRYPANLDSTFVFGHIAPGEPGSQLDFNGIPVDLTEDGAFLAYLPLFWQAETLGWHASLTDRGQRTSTLFFPFAAQAEPEPVDWTALEQAAAFRVGVSNAHTRTAVGGSYYFFPDSGTMLAVNKVSPNWLEFEAGPGLAGVIERRYADSVGMWQNWTANFIKNGEVSVQQDTIRILFETDRAFLTECTADPAGRRFTIGIPGAVCAIDRVHYVGPAREFVEDISWRQHSWGAELDINLAMQITHGYSLTASATALRLDINAKSVKAKSLRGKKIVLDPGHGGTADGAIGPRGFKEKDVVLVWSEILEQQLRKAGADVFRTRTKDIAIGLHERVQMARLQDCDAFLSLHGNALPDGENPFSRRGCGTYYYQTLSRPLAESIQREILQATSLGDDGVFDANFAVVRPTDFPAVLIEAAYMMHPDEELKLADKEFLHTLSRGVVNGLLDYFRNAPAR